MENVTNAVQQHAPQIKHAADSILAVAAMSLPAWIDKVTTVIGLISALLGLVLLAVTIYVRILEVRKRKKELDD